jgi:DNA repair exonuclease SbcCD ATPase subunit
MHQMREQERRPPTPLVAEGTREKQGMSAGLTNQLHQTAESVMKWKMQLESEIKQRDSKISEYQETIKSMKSSLLGQQQQSETLSHKLQIEMLKRGDVTTRYEMRFKSFQKQFINSVHNSTALIPRGIFAPPCSSTATT